MQFFCFCYVFLFYSSTVSCSAGSCVSSLIEAGAIEFSPPTSSPVPPPGTVIAKLPVAEIPSVFPLTKAAAFILTDISLIVVAPEAKLPSNLITAVFAPFDTAAFTLGVKSFGKPVNSNKLLKSALSSIALKASPSNVIVTVPVTAPPAVPLTPPSAAATVAVPSAIVTSTVPTKLFLLASLVSAFKGTDVTSVIPVTLTEETSLNVFP